MKLLVIILATTLFACTYTKQSTPNMKNSSNQVVFPSNYQGRALLSEPETWKDFYDGGTYLFRIGNYSLAMQYFLNAANIATGEAKKVCLAAAAVSALGANDSAQFINVRQQLTDMAAQNPFSQPTVTNQALEVFENIMRY